jgi:cation diffusion facilitator CzcD-associated flavoprotein CzcO
VTETTDVLIIGSGFAGLGMAIRLEQAGLSSFLILERADDVGGTWRDNRYPGAACDVESHFYSFSFEPNPNWSHMFARQGEIWAYIQGCVEKHRLRSRIRFGATVSRARFDETAQIWDVETADGRKFRARMLVAGCGGLSRPVVPDIAGLDAFTGVKFHSARWRDDYAFEGKKIGVIGTGASSIQIVPELAKRAERLYVFQRTPPWVMPRPDREITPREKAVFKRAPVLQSLTRSAIFWRRELYALGMIVDPRIMRLGQKLALRNLHRGIKDPELRRRLTPDYVMGCKRILLSNDYYPALARTNVELVTDPIDRVTAGGVLGASGVERELDALVLATGFEAADQLAPFEILGRGGKSLDDAWREGFEAYRGTAIAGFPNFFMIVGPNTGLGHGSMIFMIEAQIEYILKGIQAMRDQGAGVAEVRREAQRRYNDAIQERLDRTVWARGGCSSWYKTKTGKITTLWPGFMWQFSRMMQTFDAGSYVLEPRASTAVGDGAREQIGSPA